MEYLHGLSDILGLFQGGLYTWLGLLVLFWPQGDEE